MVPPALMLLFVAGAVGLAVLAMLGSAFFTVIVKAGPHGMAHQPATSVSKL